MCATKSSSDEETPTAQDTNSITIKKPNFLRKKRTLPFELRLLKQMQHDRRKKLQGEQYDDICDHISVIEMELSEVNELLGEDIETNVKQELASDYNLSKCRPAESLLSEIRAQQNCSSSNLSRDKCNFDFDEYDNIEIVMNYDADESCTETDAVIFAGPSSTSQEETCLVTEKKETSQDNEHVEPNDADAENHEKFDTDTSNDERELSAYEQYNRALKPWNRQVFEIEQILRRKYKIQGTVIASSSRIQNFRNLLINIKKIHQLLLEPKELKNVKHYAELQARVAITKTMETCNFRPFNYLSEKSILILKQADKELAEFQYILYKSKMDLLKG
ncbi:uncharacterized protein LOC131673056 [Phymastichus coffea]|uniref:uncharacterized protein LOC131673056 n=1 Tax=Phymastichus coffea TaxID=108790 RepID=UPI00273C5912|nr:uncharacterized protein LOC131673056 [Phymastichus coffea]